ncbi:MAG: glycosyltransferase family 4 protein [Bryobacteraceae bacterium]
MPAAPRVLLLVENNPYPQDFRVRREAQTLRDTGCDVAVIAPRDAAQAWSEEVDGVRVYRFPAPAGGRGVASYALEFGYATLAILLLSIWVWLRRGVDVIHAANPPDTLFVVGAVFKLLGKRYVFDQHDLAPETYLSRFAQPREGLVYRALRFVERCSYAVADVVVVTNQSYKQVAVTRGGKHDEDVFIVRNGPPLEYQPVEPDPAITGRARWLIGYVGTIGPQDGVDYLIRAMRHLVFDLGRRDVLAVVIGNGDALASVQELAVQLQVADYIWFTGRLAEAEVRRHLSAVHVCVQPDPLSPLNDKSTMNKLMEYMALGKPTVAFDLVETRYSAQEAALYVRPNDEAEFARQVSWLLDDAAECDRMGRIGRQRVSHSLSWEFSAQELLRAYTQRLYKSATLAAKPGAFGGAFKG